MSTQTLRQMAGLKAPESLDPGKTALVLIDFQGDYFDPAKLPLPDGRQAAVKAAQLIDAADAAGVRVFHVQHVAPSPASPLFAPGSSGWAFVDPVTPRPGHETIAKTLPSSFVRTELDAKLRAAGVETLVIAGLMTHMCVDATTRDAVSNGYKAIVAGDACATRDLPAGDGGTITARDVHRATLAALGDRFADVMNTDALVTLLRR
jgi:nicotinamidase-related amidase